MQVYAAVENLPIQLLQLVYRKDGLQQLSVELTGKKHASFSREQLARFVWAAADGREGRDSVRCFLQRTLQQYRVEVARAGQSEAVKASLQIECARVSFLLAALGDAGPVRPGLFKQDRGAELALLHSLYPNRKALLGVGELIFNEPIGRVASYIVAQRIFNRSQLEPTMLGRLVAAVHHRLEQAVRAQADGPIEWAMINEADALLLLASLATYQ